MSLQIGEDENNQSKSSKSIVESNKCISYFILTFLISWFSWGSSILLSNVEGHATSGFEGGFVTLAGLGPLLAAIIIIKASGGSILKWLKQIMSWKIKIRWYIVALGLPILIFSITTGIYAVLGGNIDLGGMDNIEFLIFIIPLFIYTTLLGGGIEEFGWRGFALPKLQESYNALAASLILGFFHAFWHMPMLLMPGTFHANSSFGLYVVSGLALSVLFTWLYNNTGSVILAVLFHGMRNTFFIAAILPAFDMETFEVPEIPMSLQLTETSVWLFFAILVVIVFGAEKLSSKEELPTIFIGD